MAAFALGLIGNASAESALAPLLEDPAPLVRGHAAEALGLVDAKRRRGYRQGRGGMRAARSQP
jgi:HEAT repeat protein